MIYRTAIYFNILFVFNFCIGCLPAQSAEAEIRPPVWAGRFYPAERAHLMQMIDDLTRRAAKTSLLLPQDKSLKAVIMPHAGYIYSGWTAAHVSQVLKGQPFSKVILMGPDHRVGFADAAVSDVSGYQTPLGTIKLHSDALKLRRSSRLFHSSRTSDQSEHSLEVLLPFLQRYLKSFEMIPIVMGPTNVAAMAKAIEQFIDTNTLVAVSTDLSHFLPYADAVKQDQKTIRMILNLQAENLAKVDNLACGIIPVLVLLDLARRHHWQPVLLHYCNSGDTSGGRRRVVGYASIAFYKGENMDKQAASFTTDHGQALVRLARHTLLQRFYPDQDHSALLGDTQDDQVFNKHCGTFVTLKKKGALRGCIGSLTATEPLPAGVKRNTLNAAFHDPRFPPLKPEELRHIDIEVSILSEPQPLEYNDAADLLRKLRVHVDGLIIRKESTSATFLPQVWDQLPRKEDFLSHLCLKAGLAADTWRTAQLEVLTYQVQYFNEKK